MALGVFALFKSACTSVEFALSAPTCDNVGGASFGCPTVNYVLKAAPSTITCTSGTCTEALCCDGLCVFSLFCRFATMLVAINVAPGEIDEMCE